MANAIREVTQAARAYAKASAHRDEVERHLEVAEERSSEAYEHVRELIPAALAACEDTTEWLRVYKRICTLAGTDDISVEIPLPAPKNGVYPEAYL